MTTSRILDEELFWRICRLASSRLDSAEVSGNPSTCNLFAYIADHYYLLQTKPEAGAALLQQLRPQLMQQIENMRSGYVNPRALSQSMWCACILLDQADLQTTMDVLMPVLTKIRGSIFEHSLLRRSFLA